MKRLVLLMAAGFFLATGAAPVGSAPPGPHVTARTLVPAAPLAGGTWGIAFDQSGDLWAGHINTRQITRLDPDSGRVLARFGPEQGVEGSDDVAVGLDGSVYYTAILTGEVGRIAPDGTHSTVTNLGPGVNPITVTDTGRLIVGKAFAGVGLYEVYPDGSSRIINPTSAVNAFDWWDGYLYAPSTETGEVIRIDIDAPGGDFTPVVSGLVGPGAVDIGPDGRMYVLDNGPPRVLEFDPSTGATEVVATLPSGDNMAIDARGRIFVSGGNDGAIRRVLPSGGSVAISPAGLAGPYGLAAMTDASGRDVVYAADLFELSGFDGRTGQRRLQAGAPAVFNVATLGDRLVVASWFSGVVEIVDPITGAPLTICPAMAVNVAGMGEDVIVADLLTSQVARLDMATCTAEPLAQFAFPTGLAATEDDLWAADWFMGTVRQLIRDGAPVDEVVASGLSGPEGMAVTPDGDLVVLESRAQRLSLIDLPTGTVVPLVEGLDVGQPAPVGMPPHWVFEGVAVGASGTIYVASEGIQRIELRP